MGYNPDLAVVYKEDIMKALACSSHTALQMMKRTGKSFKVGKRLAVHSNVFYNLLMGAQQDRIEVR